MKSPGKSALQLLIRAEVRVEAARRKYEAAVKNRRACRAAASNVLDDQMASRYSVTRREREVLAYIREECLSNKEIAWQLHISPRTVKYHVSQLLMKFGCRDRQQLIRKTQFRVIDGGLNDIEEEGSKAGAGNNPIG